MTPTAPYTTSTANSQRNAAIWSSTDDEILLQARASGLNWQPIASRHFPNKTANACRKRHERLVERRHVDDWDTHKLELLAREYMACRREMWEVLASRLGERWAVVEAKCMEKGLKTLQTASRTAQRKATAESQSFEDLGFPAASHHKASSSWPEEAPHGSAMEHARARSLPQLLPLYRPPPPIIQRRAFEGRTIPTSPQDGSLQGSIASQRSSPESQNGRGGISIKSIVSS
ncbi:hypothetical protein DOTSEDRAFT_40761 [Dothistroma septosporum NZE10]|uniref:Myb-like domain-containing protein n=1 Tax=Dothistroma septosporum (strain NZE10 / CBS 128990) TaxID=675120 RepID=N1Q2W9_DOTSN|nr:hypothetical protein DOTSEDRAFT_40761 [Dothistroma septosporum NZE10]